MAPRREEEVLTTALFDGLNSLWFADGGAKPDAKGATTARTANVENLIVNVHLKGFPKN